MTSTPGGTVVFDSDNHYNEATDCFTRHVPRFRVMDEQGLDGAWLFPTLGVGIEEALGHDTEAATVAFSAFNSWLHEDWGFAHRDRIFAASYLCLMDLDGAIAELERVLERGARVPCVRPGPVRTATGTTSPFAEAFDPFWARVNEAGVTVSLHGGGTRRTSRHGSPTPRRRRSSPRLSTGR